ncbi:hypothetical protein NXT3_PA00243 (plasmid) [Sinorhizobium fredii]|uniref:Uncharacterized protein n=1 Tax=Rhizobium fredii TaxID=380 RepID=A0A2L0HBG3_RHIFR|nr:hypothetical protein NXT3_PA00243 [Sinorhizobium fredii]
MGSAGSRPTEIVTAFDVTSPRWNFRQGLGRSDLLPAGCGSRLLLMAEIRHMLQ